MPYRRVEILGTAVHSITMAQTLDQIEEMIAARRPGRVVTVNPEFIMEARRNPVFRRMLNDASLSVPDGVGVVWAGRLLGVPMGERVTGIDLLEKFAGRAAQRGYRVYLLGAAPGVAEAAAARLVERNPGLIVAGTYSGSPRPEEERGICERIVAAAPDLLFVAYGSPQQELWIGRNFENLRVPVSIGVGGAFDFVASVVPRAPTVMQRFGIEWLFRLWRQPSRWRRMMALPVFALLVIRSRVLGTKRLCGDIPNAA